MDDLEAAKLFATELTALCQKHGMMIWTTGAYMMVTPKTHDSYHYDIELPRGIGKSLILSRILP